MRIAVLQFLICFYFVKLQILQFKDIHFHLINRRPKKTRLILTNKSLKCKESVTWRFKIRRHIRTKNIHRYGKEITDCDYLSTLIPTLGVTEVGKTVVCLEYLPFNHFYFHIYIWCKRKHISVTSLPSQLLVDW